MDLLGDEFLNSINGNPRQPPELQDAQIAPLHQ